VAFDHRFSPPAPVVPLTVSSNGVERQSTGYLDTGASITILPEDAIPPFAEPDGWVRVHFAFGARNYPGYPVTIGVLGSEREMLVAVAPTVELGPILGLQDISDEPDVPALIGRDVLNNTRWVFDGAAGTVTPT
jgi:hypothetical protein